MTGFMLSGFGFVCFLCGDLPEVCAGDGTAGVGEGERASRGEACGVIFTGYPFCEEAFRAAV
jgi:hypothetical protein